MYSLYFSKDIPASWTHSAPRISWSTISYYRSSSSSLYSTSSGIKPNGSNWRKWIFGLEEGSFPRRRSQSKINLGWSVFAILLLDRISSYTFITTTTTVILILPCPRSNNVGWILPGTTFMFNSIVLGNSQPRIHFNKRDLLADPRRSHCRAHRQSRSRIRRFILVHRQLGTP